MNSWILIYWIMTPGPMVATNSQVFSSQASCTVAYKALLASVHDGITAAGFCVEDVKK